jgi:endonuclease G
MKKLLIFILISIIPLGIFSQNLRNNINVKTDIFEVMYSEVLQQPLWVKYKVLCPNGNASRAGMDFYTDESVRTSDSYDYVNNVYDKGHLAPAADFNCTREMLYKTFTYLNCALQNQDLNRTTWRFLEKRERELAMLHEVSVLIKCVFTENSIKLATGATVPDAFIKIIEYNGKVEKYYFKNEKPLHSDYSKYLIK